MSVSSDGHGPVQLPVCYAGDADQGVLAEPVATFPAVRGESLSCMFVTRTTQERVRAGSRGFTGTGARKWRHDAQVSIFAGLTLRVRS